MRVDRLEQIAQHIVANASAFDMSTWHRAVINGTAFSLTFDDVIKGSIDLKEYYGDPDGVVVDLCGTAHCIAGTAEVLWPGERTGRAPWVNASEILGLDAGSMADKLFYIDDWPRQFAKAYEAAGTEIEMAQVAAERIRHFIKTNGKK